MPSPAISIRILLFLSWNIWFPRSLWWTISALNAAGIWHLTQKRTVCIVIVHDASRAIATCTRTCFLTVFAAWRGLTHVRELPKECRYRQSVIFSVPFSRVSICFICLDWHSRLSQMKPASEQRPYTFSSYEFSNIWNVTNEKRLIEDPIDFCVSLKLHMEKKEI